MSWLNFNESLNSLKGQLSNFASGVLTEGIVNTENSLITEDNEEVSDVQEKFINIELQGSSNVVEQEPPDSWSWDSPGDPDASKPISKDEIICTLQKKISTLENDKRELTVSLEQLDFDCQQTTDKLVTLKDNLQIEYDELKNDFDNLKKEYTSVLNENMAKTKQIEVLKQDRNNEELLKLQEENNILNKQLMVSLKEVKSKNELVDKVNSLQKQCDSHLESLISEKLISEELQKMYNNLEEINVSLTEKLKKYGDIEPNIINEYEAINLQSTNLALEHNTLVGENEELYTVNECLKKEIELLKTDYDNCIQQMNELKVALGIVEGKYDLEKQTHQELSVIIKQNENEKNTLDHDNEKLQGECQQLKTALDGLNSEIMKITDERDSLISQCEDLKNLNNSLINENENLKLSYNDLQKATTDLITPAYTPLPEKYFSIVSEKIQNLLDPDCATSVISDDLEISEFATKIDIELNKLICFKTKSEKLEKEIAELAQQKNNIVIEKNLEIEKLLNNSEILSQEVISKSQSLKDMEDECAELMKNNDLLITELDNYRKSSNLQTISESNEDNLLQLEIQLENANKRIQELESVVIEIESSKQDNLELELLKKHIGMTGQELNQSKEKYSVLLCQYKQLEEDKLLLKSALEKMKSDFENTEYKYTELSINFDTLKEEHEQLKTKQADLGDHYQSAVSLNNTLESKVSFLEQAEQELKQKLGLEIESNKDKEVQIQNFIERLQNSKVSETSWKLQVDTLHKELQTVIEAKQDLELKYESHLKDISKQKDIDINEKTSQLLSTITSLEEQVKELTVSRDDLIDLVKTKHEENVQYHKEIQRLNQLISGEIEKAAVLEKQLNELSVDTVSPEEITQRDEEIEKLKDQNNFLKEKCEILAHNLLQEQSNVQKVLQERQSATDREMQSLKELERLRQHLVEMEDSYTQELLQAEQKNKEMLMKVNEIEQREKDSNSIYTSVNIRANQQVETLQTQLQLVTNQREELKAIISDLEDKENKQLAALTNLQLVLEQFQRDKEKDIEQETERIRRQLNVEKQIQEELRKDIANLKLQLEESKHGLQAASRLSDQLERCKQQVYNYKDEVLKLQEQLQVSENKCKEHTSSSDMKVDRSLIKNLILGYITSNSNDQRQILKVIATVLDFNQKESERANLNKPNQGSWLSTILHPQNLHPSQDVNQQSLSEAFVRFLESESNPKVVPNLLIATQQSKDRSNSGSRETKEPSHILHEVVLPTFDDFGSSRSSSSILKGVLKNNT